VPDDEADELLLSDELLPHPANNVANIALASITDNTFLFITITLL
jgi:hypothetical protein